MCTSLIIDEKCDGRSEVSIFTCVHWVINEGRGCKSNLRTPSDAFWRMRIHIQLSLTDVAVLLVCSHLHVYMKSRSQEWKLVNLCQVGRCMLLYVGACRWMSLYVAACRCMSLYVTVCHRMSPYVTLCHRMSPYVTICHRMPPYATICHCMSPYATVCHRMPPYVTVCHRMSSYVTVCHRMSVYVDVWCCLWVYAGACDVMHVGVR